ncbi:hypothetical protein A9Q76_05965 [Arcobacter sp. 31_11_sub10_T18]|nr:hypothetical protein A9Q76_05965 [Arcobacter sp. 31_11_sub10_T18]
MSTITLCLNSQWQGCESKILATGSQKLASFLFETKPYLTMKQINSNSLKVTNGVYALDVLSEGFVDTLNSLKDSDTSKIMTVGATCDTELAPVSYLNHLYDGEMAVLWFDAHGDLNTPESSPSGHFHGMILRTLLGEGPEEFCKHIERPLFSSQVFMAGIRDLDETESEYIDGSNITVGLVDNDLVELIISAGFSKVYIHIDVDVLNPKDFKDMLMHTSGGPTCEELTQCLSSLSKKLDIVGLGVVEYCGKQKESALKIKQMLQNSGVMDNLDLDK